jgi:hypothetical protein
MELKNKFFSLSSPWYTSVNYQQNSWDFKTRQPHVNTSKKYLYVRTPNIYFQLSSYKGLAGTAVVSLFRMNILSSSSPSLVSFVERAAVSTLDGKRSSPEGTGSAAKVQLVASCYHIPELMTRRASAQLR